MRNILHRYVESQTHFGMPRGAKMSLALNEPNKVALCSNSNTTSKHAPTVVSNIDFVCKTTNGKL